MPVQRAAFGPLSSFWGQLLLPVMTQLENVWTPPPGTAPIAWPAEGEHQDVTGAALGFDGTVMLMDYGDEDFDGCYSKMRTCKGHPVKGQQYCQGCLNRLAAEDRRNAALAEATSGTDSN